jgi:ATP-dependent helicase IRC3
MAVAAARISTSTTTFDWVAERVKAFAPVVSLRDYQDEAVDAVATAVSVEGKRRVAIVLPTGAGKTVVFGALAWSWLADGLGRVLVLAHRDELITQAAAKLSLWVPRHLIGIVKASRNECDAPVVVASVQTLRNDRRLEQAGKFGLIVVDEAHHASAASYKKVLGELGAFTDHGPIVVGVTATPKRADGIRLDDVFEDIAYAKTYTEMVARNYLAPVESKAFDLVENIGRPKLGIDGDYSEGWLEGVMLRANAPDKILEAWKAEAYDRPTIVFTPTVSVAKAVAESFNGAGVSAAWVSGAMPVTERRAVLAGLASGEIRVVANCAVLTEGFDEPSVSCIVVGRPTMNETLYIQMVGRGTRLHPGKRECLVLDMVGCADQLQLDAVVDLGGRGARAAREAAEPKESKEYTDVPFSMVNGELVARSVKAVRPVCRWVNLGDGWHALSLLGDWVTAQPDEGGTWSVVYRPKRGKPVTEFEGLDLDWAKATGEGIAKRQGAYGAMHRGAKWLDRPVSEKALAYGQSSGLPVTTETTAWQMTVMQAERRFQVWRP